MKRKTLILWLAVNILLVLISIVFFVGTWTNNKKINTADREFIYSVEADETVRLALAEEKTVDLLFSRDSVKVYDSYKISRRDDILRIILFIREYATEKGYEVRRTNTRLYGEFRLHNLL